MSDESTPADPQPKPALSFKLKFAMPYYAAVGQCASTWAFLENRIDLAILSFVRDNPIPMGCALAQMFSIHAKMDALIAVAQSNKADRVTDQTVKKLVRFSQEIRPLSIQRNRIIHDPIVQEGDDVKILRLTTKGPKGSLVFELVPFDVQDFSDFIRHVGDRTEQFANIRGAMDADRQAAQPASPSAAPGDQNP
jgi:hypothetical protein